MRLSQPDFRCKGVRNCFQGKPVKGGPGRQVGSKECWCSLVSTEHQLHLEWIHLAVEELVLCISTCYHHYLANATFSSREDPVPWSKSVHGERASQLAAMYSGGAPTPYPKPMLIGRHKWGLIGIIRESYLEFLGCYIESKKLFPSGAFSGRITKTLFFFLRRSEESDTWQTS